METVEMKTLKDLYSKDTKSTEIRTNNYELREFIKNILEKNGAFKIEGINKTFEGDIEDISNEIINIIIQKNLFHIEESKDLNKRLTDINNK